MIKRKLLVAPQAMTATANPLYTVADGLSAQIMGCTIHNPTAAPITVKINYVNQAGAADATNEMLSKTLQEGESYPCPELVNHTLSAGMSLQGLGDGAVIVVSGVTFT